jgi:EpsI family protein
MLSATLVASVIANSRPTGALSKPLEEFPLRLGDWVGSVRERLLPNMEKALSATEYIGRTYSTSGTQLDLFIAYYSLQRAGETMHSPKVCLPGSGWEFWSFGSADVRVNNTAYRINKHRAQSGGKRAVLLYWYQTPDRIVANEYLGKVYLVWDSITTGHRSGSMVRIMVPDEPSYVEEAVRFASLVIPELKGFYGRN